MERVFDGDFLDYIRKKNDLTWQELAAMVGSSKGHLWDIAKKRTKEPSFALVYRLSKVLGVKMELFAKEKEKCIQS